MRDPSLLVLQPGACFHERYRVVRCLASGGMGAVYEVVDAATDAPRALKVILPNLVEDGEARSRFALEARVTGSIQSDHLVRITDAGLDTATGMPFLVMDLLDGSDLGALVEQRGPLPPAEVVLYLSQVALALDKTHAAGIVHRDLKPENLFLVRRDDGSPCVKILDFGIAKVVADSARAQQTRPMGTPLYMSPEQVEGTGAIGPRADIYSLGQIAYTLLTGEAYWMDEARGSLFALLTRIMLGPEEPPSARARRHGGALSPAFDAWFRRVTAADPAARFDRATLAMAALGEALGETPKPPPQPVTTGYAETAPSLPAPTGKRRRIAAVVVAVLAAGGAAGLVAGRASRHAPSVQAPAPVVEAVRPAATGGDTRTSTPGPEVSPGATASAVPEAPAPPTAARSVARPRATAAPRPPRALKDEGIY